MNPRLYGVLIWLCSLPIIACAKDATYFDYPLGYPSGVGYTTIRQDDPTKPNKPSYLDQIFISNECGVISHPGEDWNDNNSGKDYGSDSDDAGDPVAAIADGVVADVQYLASNDGTRDVGYAIQIRHTGHFFVPHKEDANQYTIYHSSESISTVWSIYIHLGSIAINPRENRQWVLGDEIFAGEVVGPVGDFPHGSNTNYHLHFEIRKTFKTTRYLPCGKSDEKFDDIYMSPSNFIRLNRCVPASTPPPNYETPNACPGECCSYTSGSGIPWTALQDTPLFPRHDINSQPFSYIAKNEKFTTITGVVITRQSGIAKVDDITSIRCRDTSIQSGECLAVIIGNGEGSYDVWHNGHNASYCYLDIADVNPTVDWWVYVRRSNGQEGWIPVLHGFEYCGSHPCYEDSPPCVPEATN